MINFFKNEYKWLSNFYPSHFTYLDREYKSVEHFYQSKKAIKESDETSIINMYLAFEAKKAGRKVELRNDWEEKKGDVMLLALLLKFSIPSLKDKLLGTGNVFLKEGNTWHDNYWGNCYCYKCKDIKGLNMLGKLLMEVREFYR